MRSWRSIVALRPERATERGPNASGSVEQAVCRHASKLAGWVDGSRFCKRHAVVPPILATYHRGPRPMQRMRKRSSTWSARRSATTGSSRILVSMVQPLIGLGRITSLAQTLIKLTAPGIPDFYQGTELWSLRLVDPDNRGLVDYIERRRALVAMVGLPPRQVWERADEGLPKLWTIQRALELRHRRPMSFGPDSTYVSSHGRRPAGAACGRVPARRRRHHRMVPRLISAACGRWQGTTIGLPTGQWRNVSTGEDAGGVCKVGDLWRDFRWPCSSEVPERTILAMTPVPWKRDASHNSRARHPASRRCSSLRYAQYPRSSRLAIRAPRSGTYATHHASRGLAHAVPCAAHEYAATQYGHRRTVEVVPCKQNRGSIRVRSFR